MRHIERLRREVYCESGGSVGYGMLHGERYFSLRSDLAFAMSCLVCSITAWLRRTVSSLSLISSMVWITDFVESSSEFMTIIFTNHENE
jgi:hypothetical protein